MGLWRGLKPTIAKVHGYCLGAGSDLALCADLVVASDDARFGTPYPRVWDVTRPGCGCIDSDWTGPSTTR
jgi:enoyl-CoA hydratase/carnithine racemase